MMKKISTLFLGLLLTCLFVLKAEAASKEFDTFVIFGDSLSDDGNIYSRFWHILPASPPYYQGHFSNGPVWAEYVYQDLFPTEKGENFQNYALGGAGAILSFRLDHPFTISTEVTDYLLFADKNKSEKENSLYSIWIGANNYVSAPKNVEKITSDVVQGTSDVIERLLARGGNKFLIANLPDLASLPFFKSHENKALLTQLSLTHNRKLEQLVLELRVKYPKVTFVYLDMYVLFKNSLEKATEYGFSNTADSCYLGSYRGINAQIETSPDDEVLYRNLKKSSPAMTEEQWTIIRDNPDLRETAEVGFNAERTGLAKKVETPSCQGYVFWDKMHPTTAVHKLIADYARMMIGDAGLIPVVKN